MFQLLWALALPLVINYGLRAWSLRTLCGWISVGIVLGVVERRLLVTGRKRNPFSRSLATDVTLLLLVVAASVLSQQNLVLLLPSVTNAVFALTFGGSLLRPPPLVEGFARMWVEDLSDAEVRYCRGVTWLWTTFFAANAIVSALFGWFLSLGAWTLYTGFLAYLFAGLLGAAEYLVRKHRFRRFGNGLHDRLLRRLFSGAQS